MTLKSLYCKINSLLLSYRTSTGKGSFTSGRMHCSFIPRTCGHNQCTDGDKLTSGCWISSSVDRILLRLPSRTFQTSFSFMGSKLFFLLPISLYTFRQASYKIKLNLLPFQVRNIARVRKKFDDVSLIGFKLWIFIVSMHSAVPNFNENKNPSMPNFSQG